MAKYTKNIYLCLYSTDNFFYNIVVSTVNPPLSKHTKCKDLAVANKNQTTGTPQCATNADCQVNEENLVVECFNRFPIPKF